MSEVYFTSLRTRVGESLLDKLERLVRRAGMDKIDFNNKYVAIKMHFGEPGNLAYIKPPYVARIVKIIKELGGKPFLTDCNTLYVAVVKTLSITSNRPTRMVLIRTIRGLM